MMRTRMKDWSSLQTTFATTIYYHDGDFSINGSTKKEEVVTFLQSGILFNEGVTGFSVRKKGRVIVRCLKDAAGRWQMPVRV